MISKKLAAKKAVSYIKDGMIIGLGTGSTAFFAIEAIGKMIKQGLSINAVASSTRSEALAKKSGIPLLAVSEITAIDLCIDGADEVDRRLNLVKGGGGSLLREKVIAFNSKEFIVIVDSSKLVDQLGKFPLPVEVTPFAIELTMRNLKNLGCEVTLRKEKQTAYITDNGNQIVDCNFKEILNVDQLSRAIRDIPGVVEHGLFPGNMVSKCIVGYENGDIKMM